MAVSDKTLSCVACGSDFQFTSGEQEFYANKGYTKEPRRCPRCRETRKAKHAGPRQISREMHPAVCAQCGMDTIVPFRPQGDRPVYCTDCFNQNRASG